MIRWHRLLTTATVLSAIGLTICLGLAVSHLLSPWIVIGVALLLAFLQTSLLVGRRALSEIFDGLEDLDNNPEGDLPTLGQTGPISAELWQGIVRVVKPLRERIGSLRREISTAHQVLSSLPDALLLLNKRREIIDANAAARDLFGDHLLGRDLSAALRSPAILDSVDAVLRGGPDRTVDVDLLVPVELHLSAHITPLPPLAGGSESTVLITLLNLTAMKRAEQMRVDFVANASHELRTPLSALLGFIETIQGPAAEDLEAQQRFLVIMHQQATRMSRLVEDLLSLSRIELNEHQAPANRVTIGPILQQLTQALQLKAAERQMRIEFDIGADLSGAELPVILGDADELAQVFQNLIDNSLKYGRSGTAVTISINNSERLRPGLSISVRDQGDGIPRRHLPRLTERFYRIDTARSRQMGGTGLGLAIVKHIVNRHRGLLEIESEQGLGSAFTVHLRIAGKVESEANHRGSQRSMARAKGS